MNRTYQTNSFRIQKDAKPFLKGFTLIELLVVVLIIGILAAIALPSYQKAVIKSRAAAFPVWAKRVYEAQEMYFAENGKYANNFEELGEDFSATFPVKPSDYSAASGQLATNEWNQQQYPYGLRIMTNASYSIALFNGAMISGRGGVGFRHTGTYAGQMICWEYACHAVTAGSFCQDIMGYPILAENLSCARIYRK